MARTASGLRSRIDLEAVICVDLGHHWDQTFIGRATAGKLRGLPIRVVVCSECHTRREDHLTWSGKVTSRTYDHDEAYIENARRLDDDMHERRRRFREEICRQIRDQKIDEIEATVA
jgi:uncharacterized protein YlaI